MALKKNVKKGGTNRAPHQKKRVIPISSNGLFLPLLLPLIGTLGSVGEIATFIAKAVDDVKAEQ